MTLAKTNFTVQIVGYVGREAEIISFIVLHARHVFLLKDLTIINAWKMPLARNAQYASKTNLIL